MLGALKTDSPHFVLLTQGKLFRSKGVETSPIYRVENALIINEYHPLLHRGFPAYKDRRTTSPTGTWVVRFRVLKGYWEKKSCKDDEPCAHRELRVLYYDANTSRVKWVYGSAGRSFDRKRKQIKIKIKRRLPFATNVASNASTGPSHAANSGVSIPAAQVWVRP
ncbi:uncharacterized protein CIMG_07205 [Coccidioides immitis RS]|uniref:Uncharacterized protein n=1 Tax=Coccidioides immitis (strain RS) TaxID=246410 RepID=J3K9U9_COCIM|nr:uncharacterized protein CIMG_07205 [Coccidioides immitis RS]EAS31726.3 hypothetical protein CIMG_07205 [Coccidioides immitis RS]